MSNVITPRTSSETQAYIEGLKTALRIFKETPEQIVTVLNGVIRIMEASE